MSCRVLTCVTAKHSSRCAWWNTKAAMVARLWDLCRRLSGGNELNRVNYPVDGYPKLSLARCALLIPSSKTNMAPPHSSCHAHNSGIRRLRNCRRTSWSGRARDPRLSCFALSRSQCSRSCILSWHPRAQKACQVGSLSSVHPLWPQQTSLGLASSTNHLPQM